MTARTLELPDGGSLAVDEKGYLLDWTAWTPAAARAMAQADGVQLSEDHWLVLDLFRQYYEKFEIEPPMRALVRMVREQPGNDQADSRWLYRLFPDGPQTQGCRYAGLPRPLSCV